MAECFRALSSINVPLIIRFKNHDYLPRYAAALVVHDLFAAQLFVVLGDRRAFCGVAFRFCKRTANQQRHHENLWNHLERLLDAKF